MRKTIALNNGWLFCQGFDQQYVNTTPTGEVVDIPHTVKLLPYNCFDEKCYQGQYTYQKTVNLTKDQLGGKVLLNFEAVAHRAEVYCNGNYVMQHLGGYTAFVADITAWAVVGNNIITVMVDTTENGDIPPFSGVIDYLCYGGIYREVQLVIVPQQYITTLHVSGDMQGNMSVAIDLSCNQPTNITLQLFDGNCVDSWDITANGYTTVSRTYSSAKLWDIDNPNLYTVVATLDNGDSVSARFGFRSCVFKNNGFFLNGKPIKLLGLNRHQSYAYVGYAMPRTLQQLDADKLKASGCNIVRHSHYPQSRHFLDRCDEIGLLSFVEAPGWQSIGDTEFCNNYLGAIAEMITEQYNHPSIVIWGVRVNESADCDQLYTQSNQLAHALDSTRQTTGVRYIRKSHLIEDVYSYNDFVHCGNNRGTSPKRAVCGNVPLLITEHNGHMYPTKPYDYIEKRVNQTLRHAKVINDAFANDGIAGVIGWCFADYNTHIEFGSGDRICYHGVMDMFRLPKLAHGLYASQQSTTPVLEIIYNASAGDYNAMRRSGLYIASNCTSIKVYNNDRYIDTFYPSSKQYSHLPHPLYYIPHLIKGEVSRLYGYSAKDGDKITNALIAGVNGMQATDILPVLSVMLKHRKPMSYWQSMAMTVVMRNGQDDNYKLVGYFGDKPVITKTMGEPTSFAMTISTPTPTITLQDTYEIAQVDVAVVDNHGIVATYCDQAVTVVAEGGTVIGEATQPLIGGRRGFFVKVDKPTVVKITVSSNNYPTQTLSIDVT